MLAGTEQGVVAMLEREVSKGAAVENDAPKKTIDSFRRERRAFCSRRSIVERTAFFLLVVV